MKTIRAWKAKWTVRGFVEPHSDDGCFAATATIEGVRMVLSRCADMSDKACEAFVGDYTQACLIAEVRDGEQLLVQPPEGWQPKHLLDGRQVVWKVPKALPGLRTSPRRLQEHLTKKLRMSENHVCSLMWSEVSAYVCMRTTCCEGHGQALAHGDRETSGVPGTILCQAIEQMSERHHLLATEMERRKILPKGAPEEFQKQILQEIKELEEQLSKEELDVLGQKHSLERMNKERGMPKRRKGERSLPLKVDLPVTAIRSELLK